MLASLLDSEIPQSILIKNMRIPKNIDVLIVDTVLRNKFTLMRFMNLKVDVETRRVVWNSRKYIIPADSILKIANEVLLSYPQKLENSFLTKSEIAKLYV